MTGTPITTETAPEHSSPNHSIPAHTPARYQAVNQAGPGDMATGTGTGPPITTETTGAKPKFTFKHIKENTSPNQEFTKTTNASGPSPGSSNSPSSAVVTLEPHDAEDDGFTLQRKQRIAKQKRLKQRRITQILFDQSNQEPRFPKFFSMKFPRLEIDTKINVIATDLDIKRQIGFPKTIKKQNRDTLLIEVKSAEQGKKLLATKNIAGEEVHVQEHVTMNQSKGTLYSETLSNSTLDELYEALKPQGVVKIERMKRKVSGTLTDTHRYIITFNRSELPPLIKLTDWHHELVEQYVPTPLRCVNCQRLGHTKNHCRRKDPTCARCSENGHVSRDCHENPLCINCSGAHSSMDRKCPQFLFKSEVLATQVKLKLSYREAEDLTKEKYRAENQTYSSAVRNQQPRNQTEPNRTASTRSVTTVVPSPPQRGKPAVVDSVLTPPNTDIVLGKEPVEEVTNNLQSQNETANGSSSEKQPSLPKPAENSDISGNSELMQKQSENCKDIPLPGKSPVSKIPFLKKCLPPLEKANPTVSKETSKAAKSNHQSSVKSPKNKNNLPPAKPKDQITAKNPKSEKSNLKKVPTAKDFLKPNPEPKPTNNPGKKSELKRSESVKSLSLVNYDSDDDKNSNLPRGRRKRSDSESSPSTRKNQKLSSQNPDVQPITVVGAQFHPTPSRGNKWK